MTGGIVDVHTHAFPDPLAPRAVAVLSEKGSTKPFLSGTVGDLVGSMDRAGIEVSVVCSIATDPRQFKSILEWSNRIAGPRILPFPSVHPRSPRAVEEIAEVAGSGHRGIKLHPEYQDFFIDDPAMSDFYGAVSEAGLVVLFHAGFDIGFPDSERSSPARIAEVSRSFPRLRVVASHLGGFRQWEQVGEILVGKDIFLDTSYVFGHIPPSLLRGIISSHRPDRLLFGSDSPWADQKASLRALETLDLGAPLTEKILSVNARELLGL